jgi:DNA replication protein DnaC
MTICCSPTEALMSNAASEAVIQEYCRELKLAAVVRDYPGLCRRARDGGWAYEDLLRELLEAEVANRHQSAARRLLREARFPDIKTLDQLDWSALKGVSRPKLMELASCEFIGRAEDVILAGPIGSGKTHVAIALGVEATRRRLKVHFTRAADLAPSLLEARDERRLTALQQRYQKVALLVVDELGCAPRGADTPRGLRDPPATDAAVARSWGQVERGDARETVSSPDNVAAWRHCQTPWPRKQDGKVQRK